tara:strand:+ start:1638 stop:1859 length:222 start_codon:yes stop_codon:yes gene_type:complete
MPRGIPNAKPEVDDLVTVPGLDEPILQSELDRYEAPARAAWRVQNPASQGQEEMWWPTMVPTVKAAITAWEGI